MFKKLISATLVLIMIGTTGTVSYTLDDGTSSNSEKTEKITKPHSQILVKGKLEVVQPQDNLITSSKTILLSGSAPEDSKVIVEVYSTPYLPSKDFTVNNFVLSSIKDLDENKMEELFLPPTVKEIEVGAFGIFVDELEVKLGLNKLKIYIEGHKDESKMRLIYVNDVTEPEELIQKIDNLYFFEKLRQIFSDAKLLDHSTINTRESNKNDDVDIEIIETTETHTNQDHTKDE